MATHSSVLAWRIPEAGEPGGLPSVGSHSRTRLKRLSSSSRAPWDTRLPDSTDTGLGGPNLFILFTGTHLIYPATQERLPGSPPRSSPYPTRINPVSSNRSPQQYLEPVYCAPQGLREG